MRSRILWIVALVGCLLASTVGVLGLAAQGQGQGGGNKGGKSDSGGSIPVCVTFRDDVADRITSDGISEYCGGSDGVLAGVGKNRGGFRLDTNNKGRLVSLDFSDCVSGETCVSPFATGDKDSQDVDLRLGEKYEFDITTGKREPTGQKLDIVEMNGGETAFGALNITFAPTGKPAKLQYKVVFGQIQFIACTGGDPVTVTRGGTAGSPTNSWTMFAAAGDEACLFEIVDNFKEVNLVGRFHMPFSIDLDEQP